LSRGRGIRFSVGYGLNDTVRATVLEVPEPAWLQAIDSDGADRDGAWVAELDFAPPSSRPEGSRLICRCE